VGGGAFSAGESMPHVRRKALERSRHRRGERWNQIVSEPISEGNELVIGCIVDFTVDVLVQRDTCEGRTSSRLKSDTFVGN